MSAILGTPRPKKFRRACLRSEWQRLSRTDPVDGFWGGRAGGLAHSGYSLISDRVDQVLAVLRGNYALREYQQNRLLNFCEAVS